MFFVLTRQTVLKTLLLRSSSSELSGRLPGYVPQSGSKKTLFYSCYRCLLIIFMDKCKGHSLPRSLFLCFPAKDFPFLSKLYCCVIPIVRFRTLRSPWEGRWAQVPSSEAPAVVSHDDGLDLSLCQVSSPFNPKLSPWRVSGVRPGRSLPSCAQT